MNKILSIESTPRLQTRASSTAVWVAALRSAQTHDYSYGLPGSDNVVSKLLPLNLRILGGPLWNIGKLYANFKIPGIYEWIYCRTRYYDNLLERAIQSGVQQIVILGAGLDTRGIRFKNILKSSNVKLFELDHPRTQALKLSKLNTKSNQHIKYLPVNFESETASSALLKNGFITTRSSLFFYEGVLMYLNAQAVIDSLTDLSLIAAPKSILAFDFCTANTITGKENKYGAQHLYKELKRRSEYLKWGCDPSKVSLFLRPFGLKIRDLMDGSEIERKYLTNSQQKVISPMTGFNNLVEAQW